MRRLKKRIKGLALSTILLAVVLLAAIAVTIAISSRAGNASSSQQQDRLLATTILNQAQQIKTGIELAMSNGVDISTITTSFTAPAVNFWPASASISSQIAPAQASIDPSSFYWNWHGASYLARIMNVGTGAGNYAIELDPLRQGVCQQINQLLFGDPTIPTITSSGHDWMNPLPVDASADTTVAGIQEGCFLSPYLSQYFYYKVILVQ